jgi:hypothetical protein
MPDNKKQHYVPKMVLRNFASDPDQKQISLIHIKTKKVIHAASLRDQCQKDYLYGQDRVLERELAEMEGAFHRIIDRLISTESIDRDFQARYHIIELLALQKSRTLQAEAELNRMTDQLAKLMMYNRFERNVIERVTIEDRNAAAQNVIQSLKFCPIMYDLKHFLVVNRTSTPFIISDNPVSHTNWFCHSRLPGRSAGGTAKSGLQIFMPIAPRHAILLHDKYVYEANASNQVIQVRDRREVDALNEIQWLNAYKNIYFPPTFEDADIERCLSWPRVGNNLPEVIRLNPTNAEGIYVVTDKTVLDAPDQGVTRELVHFRSPESTNDIRLNSVRIRPKPTYFDNGSAGSPSRDPIWAQIVEEFVQRVENERLPFNKLWDSASSHPLFPRVGSEIRKIERSLKTVR